MRAVICNSLSGPDKLVIENLPRQSLKNDQIRVEIKAAALNYPDILMTYGKYQFKPALPFIPGMEAAGNITELGADVTGWHIGDRVMAKSKIGAFAEEAVVSADQLLPMPDIFTYEQGAAFSVGYLTAYISLIHRAELQPGETVLIHGAGGGVGMAAIDVAKWHGATVIAVASSAEKLALAKSCGADHLINHRQQDFVQEVKDITAGTGADVIFDPVGGSVFERSLKCINWGGRLLVIGFTSGEFGNLKTNLALLKGCSIVGVRAGEYIRHKPEIGRHAVEALYNAAEKGLIKPIVTRTWLLDDVVTALKTMEAGEVVGKNCIVF